jgi:branched-chain amino acid transport system substrate-binding protein
MRILRWRGPLIVVVLMTMAPACTGAAQTPPTGVSDVAPRAAVESSAGDTPSPTGEAIRIGGTLGLTGAFSGPSAAYMAAYEYWAADVNASGGLLGRPVELVIYDDVSSPTTARGLYQRLIDQDEVDLLLAPYGTVIGQAVLPLAEHNEMVLFNGGFAGIEMFRSSEWMVGAATYQEPDVPRGVFELVDTLPWHRRPRRIGIATERDPFTLRVRDGVDGEGGVLALAAERGIAVVLNEEYSPGASDVAEIVDEARARDVDMFFALSQPNDAALLARVAHSVGFEPDIYCACGAQVTSLPSWRELGPAADGVMSLAMAWPTDDFPAVEGLYEHARSELGYPELPVALTAGYAILQVLQQAVEQVGVIDQAALRDHVTGRTIDTVIGPIAYDHDGVPAYAALLVQYQHDHNEVVWPADRATSAPRIPMKG